MAIVSTVTRRRHPSGDISDDPGLECTSNVRPDGAPFVGRSHGRLSRFSPDAHFDAVFRELHEGFGPQAWWPAETPFEVIVGAVLTQNTAWRNVEKALSNLRAQGRLTPARILTASSEFPGELEEALRPSGYFRAKAKKLAAVSQWYLGVGGLHPLMERPLEPLRNEILGVYGIGPETADSILCYAAGRRTAVIDTYTRRIFARHELADGDAPYEQLRQYAMERLEPSQAVYEEFHALCVRTGFSNCKPRPRCVDCPATTPSSLTRIEGHVQG